MSARALGLLVGLDDDVRLVEQPEHVALLVVVHADGGAARPRPSRS